ncbi:MAG: iron-sulfur cluster assembly protein [Bacteroidota bacterium]
MALRDDVIDVIRTIYDPEIPVNIYELGLIYEINVYEVIPGTDEKNVHILMTLTSPNCPAAEDIPAEIQQKVSSIPNVKDLNVELTFDPPYSMEMMSEAAKLELGFM